MLRRPVETTPDERTSRLSRAGTGFGVMVAAGSGVRVTSEVDALFAAMSARAGATVISFNWARLRRPARRRRCRREIRVLVVADPYAGIGDEPVSGGDRVARA